MRLAFASALLGFAAAGAAYAVGQEVVLRTDDCRRLVAHAQAPDVAYRPGVDVRGRPVAPADLEGSGSAVKTPDRIVIALDIPLKEFLGGAAPPRLGDAEVEVGQVVLEAGRLTYDGQALPDPAAHAIAEQCRRILSRGG